MDRRQFIAAGATLPALLLAPTPAAAKGTFNVGITVDTRPDWNGPANFIRSIDEASSVGYHRIETFWPYVQRWADMNAANWKNLEELLLKDTRLQLG